MSSDENNNDSRESMLSKLNEYRKKYPKCCKDLPTDAELESKTDDELKAIVDFSGSCIGILGSESYKSDKKKLIIWGTLAGVVLLVYISFVLLWFISSLVTLRKIHAIQKQKGLPLLKY